MRLNPLVLAYVGDAVHALWLKSRLAVSSDRKAGALSKISNRLLSARAQSEACDRLSDFFDETEKGRISPRAQLPQQYTRQKRHAGTIQKSDWSGSGAGFFVRQRRRGAYFGIVECRLRKGRGIYLMNIEGKNAVGEALRAGTTIDVLLVEKGTNHPLVAQARAAGIKIQFVDRSVLERESVSKRHQGFIARATEFDYCEVEDILAESKRRGEDAFVVILDGIEDPHNLGSILRVCECAGVHGVIIPKNRAASVNDTAVRTSAGASQYVKVARVANLSNAIATLKKAGLWVFCADMDGREITECNLKGPLALVIGGEDRGVSRLVKENCDGAVSIKMKGKINSLNASVACGVAVYEALRQRG